jgi:hypothetical protein
MKKYLLLDNKHKMHIASFEHASLNDTRICLKGSKYGDYPAGSPIATIDDDGNGADIFIADGNLELRLNYSQLADLALLLERYTLAVPNLGYKRVPILRTK